MFSYKAKEAFSKIIFWFLGRGIQSAAHYDSTIKDEISRWNEGIMIMMKIGEKGPHLIVEKRNGSLIFLQDKGDNIPTLTIQFKHINIALKLLAGQIGIAQGFAEHRFTMKGDIAFGMSFVRILYLVEAYLFPAFIANKILKKVPRREVARFKIYRGLFLGVK